MTLWFQMHNRRWFWRFRAVWARAIFHVSSIVFARKERVREFREHASISRQLLAVCRPSLFAAVATVVLCELAWPLLLAIAQRTHAARVLAWLTNASVSVSANGSTMDTLLSVIASVCGVFLALYFTAVSVVAQTAFAAVPNAVKDLLLREKAGNLYMRILTLLTCVTLILLGTHALGHQPSPVSLLVTLILGVLGIISFMALGFRTFYFLDFSRLANVVTSDFLRSARMATSSGFRWYDSTFQAHYHKLAKKDLQRAQNLVTLCQPTQTTVTPEAEAAEVVLKHLIVMMGVYAKMKRRIPSDSHWYARSPQHKSWFLQDHIAIDMAIRTQTPIQPTMVADHSWVETQFASMLAATWKPMLSARARDAVLESLYTFGSYIEELGSELDLAQATMYLHSARELLDAHYAAQPVSEVSESLVDLGVLDALGYCMIAAAVGFFKHIHAGSPQQLVTNLKDMKWEDRSAIYTGVLPASLLPRMEYINRCVTFERRVEGCTVSPMWYLRQLIVIEYCDVLQACFTAIIDSFSALSLLAAEWNKRQGATVSTLFAHRALELHFKIMGNLPDIKRSLAGLRVCEVCREITAKRWDWDAIEKRIADTRVTLIGTLALALPGLSTEKEVSGYPDFFGQTYNTVCQACYEALRENREQMLTEVFPALFLSALKGHDALRQMLRDRDQRQAVSLASEPLLDVMALSGYAQLYSDLHHNPLLWSICQDVWVNYLGRVEDARGVIQFLVACQNLRRQVFQLYPRDILRTNWEIELNRALEEVGLLSRWDTFGPAPETGRRSATPLLRAYCRGGHHTSGDVAAVFIIVFLLRQSSAEGLLVQFTAHYWSATHHIVGHIGWKSVLV